MEPETIFQKLLTETAALKNTLPPSYVMLVEETCKKHQQFVEHTVKAIEGRTTS